jgi:hypothetical protein
MIGFWDGREDICSPLVQATLTKQGRGKLSGLGCGGVLFFGNVYK